MNHINNNIIQNILNKEERYANNNDIFRSNNSNDLFIYFQPHNNIFMHIKYKVKNKVETNIIVFHNKHNNTIKNSNQIDTNHINVHKIRNILNTANLNNIYYNRLNIFKSDKQNNIILCKYSHYIVKINLGNNIKIYKYDLNENNPLTYDYNIENNGLVYLNEDKYYTNLSHPIDPSIENAYEFY